MPAEVNDVMNYDNTIILDDKEVSDLLLNTTIKDDIVTDRFFYKSEILWLIQNETVRHDFSRGGWTSFINFFIHLIRLWVTEKKGTKEKWKIY